MRFITECKDEEILPVLYDTVDYFKSYLDKTKLVEMREKSKEQAKAIREDKTLDDEAKDKKIREKGIENFMEMLRIMCKDYPKETAEIHKMLWVCDKDEETPNIFITLKRIPKMLTEESWFIDFFTSVVLPML